MNNGLPNPYPGACRKDIPYPSVSHESVPSLIDNLVNSLYGTITKSVVGGRVVWNLPCDPSAMATIFGVPRIQGEGLMCYILRVFGASTTLSGNFQGTFSGNLLGGSAGTLVYQTAKDTTAFLTPGATGTVLTSNGNSLVWTTGVVVDDATNLFAGTAGQIPYQQAASTTQFFGGAGTSGVLHSNGTSTPSYSAVTPSDLSTGHPTWDTAGNFSASTTGAQTSITSQPSGINGQGNLTAVGTDGSGANASVVVVFASAGGGGLYQRYALPMLFYTNAIERMRLDVSGNLGIGTQTPSTALQVTGTGITTTTISAGSITGTAATQIIAAALIFG